MGKTIRKQKRKSKIGWSYKGKQTDRIKIKQELKSRG